MSVIFFLLAFTAGGYLIGTKINLLIQLVILISILVYNIRQKSFQELASVIPFICTAAIFAGMLIGNVVYFFAHYNDINMGGIKTFLSWVITP